MAPGKHASGVGDEHRTTLLAAREMLSRDALLLIVVVGAIVRFATLGSQGYWFDEHATIVALTQRLAGLLPRILSAESNPPLYYLVAGGWEKVFGLGEVGLRSL